MKIINLKEVRQRVAWRIVQDIEISIACNCDFMWDIDLREVISSGFVGVDNLNEEELVKLLKNNQEFLEYLIEDGDVEE